MHIVMRDTMQDVQRKTVNLSSSTAAAVQPFFSADGSPRLLLQQIVGEDLTSESDVLRALVTVGIRSVLEQQLDAGYAEWAAAQDPEDEEWAEASTASLAGRIERDDG